MELQSIVQIIQEMKRLQLRTLRKCGWQSMKTAPHTAEWVEVKTVTGHIVKAHWASNLSGEEQPPFQGWFARGVSVNDYYEITPIAWRPLK